MPARTAQSWVAAVLVLMAASAAAADIQWTALRLHPDGAYNSSANASWGGRQGGVVTFSGQPGRAALWDGSEESWTDLTPSWGNYGIVHGMDRTRQVGASESPFEPHATLWRGTAQSAVDLHPDPAIYRWSEAMAVSGQQVVGRAGFWQTGESHAALWNGTPESFVDLHPSVALWSEALATDGTLQGGRVDIRAAGVGRHAALWAGSAQSFVDLNPAGSVESVVRGMAQGVQVGRARWQGQSGRAALWRGSAQSYVDMNPPGGLASELFATDGTLHVGAANFGGFSWRAGIWLSDDPNSYVNLHTYLSHGAVASSASAVWTDGATIYVSGAISPASGPLEAWLWVGTVPAPSTAGVLLTGAGVAAKRRRRR